MIAGATRGRGGGALARHFLQVGDGQQRVRVVDIRGLAAASTLEAGRPEAAVREGFRELDEISAHGRTDRWCHHVHVDPPPEDPDPRGTAAHFLRLYEQEFQLGDQARIVVEHEKGGRVHWHAAYTLIGEDGRMVDGLSHHHRRSEKVARITEVERVLPLTKGAHNRSVIAALRREGRNDVAVEMERAGLDRGGRARAAESPQERAQRERSGAPAPREIGEACLAAWREAGSTTDLRDSLERRGLLLRQGEKGPVVIDRSGAAHSIIRRLGEASKRIEGERIRAKTVRAFLAEERLPRASDGQARTDVDQRRIPDWARDVEAAVWRTKARRGGVVSLRSALRAEGISMSWDAPRKRWLLSRGKDDSCGLLAAAGDSLRAGELRELRKIDEGRRGMARACIERIERGEIPTLGIAEMRKSGLTIKLNRKSGWQVVGDDGGQYGRADTLCGREPGALDAVLEEALGRDDRRQGEAAPARTASVGRLAQELASEGASLVREILEELADEAPSDQAVAESWQALHSAHLSGRMQWIDRARTRLMKAEEAYAAAYRRWERRVRRRAEARRRARAREHERRERQERGR